MRSFFVVGLAALSSAIAIGSLVTGCGSSSCDDTDSCGAYTGGKAGTGGAGGGTGGSGATGGTSGGGGGGTGGTGGTSGTGGTGGAGGTGGDSGTCDTTKSPSEEACLVSDAHAVFVNGTATSGGTGTKASPFKTIGEALSAAGGKLILVCDTNYDEHVKLTAGVKLYGGFSCTDWAYETGKRAAVKPASKGHALEIDSVSASVVIEDVEFASIDAAAAGESSIAALVNASTDVKLRRVKLAAGKGMAGANGVLAAYTYPTQASLNGKSASGATGGGLSTCSCPGGTQSIGGKGGDGVPPSGQAGSDGGPALGAGQAGTPGSCGTTGTGKDGKAGSPAADAAGASTSGTLNGGVWSPSPGALATPGGVGQGGGGGASTSAAGGGGGGCGGCGGAGGPGGGGGGASIALIAVSSTISVSAGSELTTSDAGNGGTGASGQAGQTDYGFLGNGTPPACPGGNGAPGGGGGAGGGGAGGISVAVLWKGTAAPTVDSGATITLGKKGTKGAGGKAGSNDGVDGAAQNSLEAK